MDTSSIFVQGVITVKPKNQTSLLKNLGADKCPCFYPASVETSQ